MADLRFCAYQYQHLPLDALRGRWRDAERSGFDVLWNCDTVVEPDRPRHTLFDGPATLTMMAADTRRIRVGTLVTSLYFRQPVTFAKAAVTVDHLSGGRMELALGVGDPSAGAKASGVDWPAGERVARFREFTELVDLLLRQEVTTYRGQFYRCEEAETVPLPVQQPRPPVTIAAHGPKMLRIAAEHGDGWSSWGGYDVATEEAFYAVTADRSHRFDDLCVAADRDPASIRHSLVCFPPLTPWQSVEYFQDMVGRFSEIGIDEFVLYWPQTWGAAPREAAVFEEVTAAVMPRLRPRRHGRLRGSEASLDLRRRRPDSRAVRRRLWTGPAEYCFLIYPGGLAHGGMPMYERLLVAVDHSETSDRVIAAARDIASLSKGKVWVLHLREREFGRVGRTPTESDEEAREAVTHGVEALIQAGVDAQGEVREALYGHAAREIVEDAKKHDAGVIIMGSRGRSDIAGLVLGSTAHKVIHLTDRPVLVVR